jgi:hypothetical protein
MWGCKAWDSSPTTCYVILPLFCCFATPVVQVQAIRLEVCSDGGGAGRWQACCNSDLLLPGCPLMVEMLLNMRACEVVCVCASTVGRMADSR